jgi:hypothetical protein
MIGVELTGSMVVEDEIASSVVRLFNHPFRDDGGPLLAKCFAPRCRERFTTETNNPRVGVGSSPAGLCARLRKLDSSERTYKASPSALNVEGV